MHKELCTRMFVIVLYLVMFAIFGYFFLSGSLWLGETLQLDLTNEFRGGMCHFRHAFNCQHESLQSYLFPLAQ